MSFSVEDDELLVAGWTIAGIQVWQSLVLLEHLTDIFRNSYRFVV